jgi:GntR family transcriptional regulator
MGHKTKWLLCNYLKSFSIRLERFRVHHTTEPTQFSRYDLVETDRSVRYLQRIFPLKKCNTSLQIDVKHASLCFSTCENIIVAGIYPVLLGSRFVLGELELRSRALWCMTSAELELLKPSDIDPSPKYLQIARKMVDLIETNVWPAEQGLPSERQLVDLLEVSRVTARRALQVVSEKGLVVRKPGSGTYVAPRLEQPLSRLTSFSDELRQRGMTSSSTWLMRDVAMANSQEMMALGLAGGTRVARLKRLRRADESPMAFEYSRIPESKLPDPSVVQQSLYECLDASGFPVVRALQTMSATNATAEQAKLLEIDIGQAVIFVTRIGYGRDGRPMELTESYCRADVYEFVAELTRNPATVAPMASTRAAASK